MTSRLTSLLRMFGPRAMRAADRPNARVTATCGRRCLENKEQEDDEQEEEKIQSFFQRVLEESEKGAAPSSPYTGSYPVAQTENISSRKEYLQEHYRNMVSATRSQQQHEEQERVQRPNLDIPAADGQSYMTLAQ